MSKYLGILFLFIVVIAGSLTYGNQKTTFRESKIGGFDFSAKLITNQQLMKLYGKGCVDKNYPYFYYRMYYFPEKDIYVAFDIQTDDLVVGLKLSNEPITSKECRARKGLDNYQTGKKITLGDSKEKVVDTYGTPYRIEEDKEKKLVTYKYHGDDEDGRPWMNIVFSNNRVFSISISVGD